jgi:cephalosporin hydroxylase
VIDLSVIIPARNEVYLQRTIESVLENITADTEVIAICDGYWPDPPINDHPRVNIIHHSEARGQRQSINEAARIAHGKYLMKLDAHCAVAPGFDRQLIDDYQPGWTVVPRMYNLDVSTWKPKLHKRTDYMYIGWNDKKELRTLYYEDDEWKQWHKRTEEIDEVMSCMGPGWFISAEQFWKQGGCDETHGSWGQQGVEVALKAWLSGNALMVNKRTWFAHWFRASDGGFPYPIQGSDISKAREYSKDLWTGDKWEGATRKFNWLVGKFNPPGWEGILQQEKIDDLSKTFYRHCHLERREPVWRGVRVIKLPTDLINYAEVIQQNKPKWIIEAGTKFGGSALFFQDMIDIVGYGRVITIDKYPVEKVKDSRIIYIEDSSTNVAVVERIREMVGSDPVMVVLDSDHSRVHVKWELKYYAGMVTPGQYLVVEDCYDRNAKKAGPGEAVDWFLSVNKDFEQTNLDRRYLVGFCRGGWLRRK